MTRRFFTRATEDPTNPAARAICDRCGMVYDRAALRPQLLQAPGTLLPTQLYVCPPCYDAAAPFMRTVWYPVDPPNISFPSPESYAIDEATTWTLTKTPPGAPAMFVAYSGMSVSLAQVFQFLASMTATGGFTAKPIMAAAITPVMGAVGGFAATPIMAAAVAPAMGATGGFAATPIMAATVSPALAAVGGFAAVPIMAATVAPTMAAVGGFSAVPIMAAALSPAMAAVGGFAATPTQTRPSGFLLGAIALGQVALGQNLRITV